MADREKLIDVFMHMGDHIRSLDEYGFGYDSTLAKAIEDVVELLKNPGANGVTFATENNVGYKWVPVTESLPEADGRYLVHKNHWGSTWFDVLSFAKDGRKVDEYDFRKNWKNVWYNYDSEWGHVTTDSVTHWMPLPEPPKEG